MAPRKKQQSALPKTVAILPGTVHAQMVCCGRDNCRCARGELHGPYYYRFFRVGGRLKKQYVKQSEVGAVAAACLARQIQKRHMIEAMREAKSREQAGRIQWRSLLELLKQLGRDEP